MMLSAAKPVGISAEKSPLAEPSEAIRRHPPFLLLPTEVRSEIYTHVLSFLTYPTSEVHASSRGPERVLEPKHSVGQDQCIRLTRAPPPSPYNTGVVSLLLSCRQVYHEMMACIDLIYRGPSPRPKFQAELELILHPDHLTPTWTAIPPVPLSQWKTIVVKVMPKQRVKQWWGNGGPMPIGRHLLRLFGMFVQYGPSFRKDMPFGKLMESPPKIALDEMKFLVAEVLCDADGPDARSNPFPMYDGLNGYLAIISESGLLYGKVKLLKVVTKDLGKETLWVVHGTHEAMIRRTAIQWRGYGWIPGYLLKD